MSQATNIVIADALPTPVNHTFSPQGTTMGMALFEDKSAAALIGNPRIRFQLKSPSRATASSKNKNKRPSVNHRLTVSLELPVLEVVSNSTISGITPAPTLSYRVVASMICILPDRCTLQDRQSVLKMFKLLLADTQVTTAVHNLELPY